MFVFQRCYVGSKSRLCSEMHNGRLKICDVDLYVLYAGVGGQVGTLDATFGFYLREAFQSQTNTEKDIIQ